MKPEELVEFDSSKYQAQVRGGETNHLREQEIVKIRQLRKAVADVTLGSYHAIVTGGITAIAPIYASRQGEVADAKLKIIQAELTRRGVPLHIPNEADDNAVAASVAAGEMVGADLDADFPDVPFGVEMATEETAADIVDGSTEAKVSGGTRCSRVDLEPYHRLRCCACGVFFDTSFTPYLREAPGFANWLVT